MRANNQAKFKLSEGFGYVSLPDKITRQDWRKIMALFEVLDAKFVCVPNFDEEKTVERLEMGA